MSKEVVVEALVEGGKASAGPPIGPALGPTGVNLFQVVQEINNRTESFKGMRVPVTIKVNTDDKTFAVQVGTPPTSALILKEVSKDKGSAEAGTEIIGDISMEQVVKIAKMKSEQMLAKGLKQAVRTVIGTCVSMGIQIDGQAPREVQQEISEGKHDSSLEEER